MHQTYRAANIPVCVPACKQSFQSCNEMLLTFSLFPKMQERQLEMEMHKYQIVALVKRSPMPVIGCCLFQSWSSVTYQPAIVTAVIITSQSSSQVTYRESLSPTPISHLPTILSTIHQSSPAVTSRTDHGWVSKPGLPITFSGI